METTIIPTKQVFLWALSLFMVYSEVQAQGGNTSYGTGAGTGGEENSFFGENAGSLNSDDSNTYIGYNSGRNNTGGYNNTFIGHSSGRTNTTGYSNIFIGASSGFRNTTGDFNVFLGTSTGRENTTARNNTYLGYTAGYNATGNSNVFIGSQAGYNETGSNKLYIDNSNTATPLIYGDFSSNQLGINTIPGTGFTLDVGGNLRANGSLTLNEAGYIDDDVTFGGQNDDWIRLHGYIEMKSATDDYGIVLRNKDANDYLGITQVDGSSYLTESSSHGNYFIKGTNRDTYLGNHIYGKSVNEAYSNLYKFGGLFLTWDSDNYGTNEHHSVRSTYGDTYGDDITINSYDHLRFNLDANNNNPNSYFEVGQHTTDVENVLFRIVSPSGNVGIGTTSPDYKLDVNGPVNATELRVNGELLNIPTQFWNQTGTDIDYIAGKVGIGTATPAHTLDVNGAINATEIRLNGEIFNPTVWTQSGTDINYLQGTVGIGTATVPMGYRLAVDGNIVAEEIQIQLSDTWPDYVFEEDYDLKPLSEVEAFVKANKHLPDVPSASEVVSEGQRLGEMNAILLKKVEELTLYLIRQQATIEAQENKIKELYEMFRKGNE
ncbi:hypothetical protein FNH22_12715 [Fulvivirga sp. M361]|uniref:hypothetical protein n=1 Tax=Fulvivirga sp. M361 TaxID=2594266 RepID=UPI00117A10AE|nr:hypothetical protein [Fulvivirga sp. M361]TRX58733.1 hypothetical protein FNH22_12715 [Fulvivirga sp. M361]